MNAMRELHFIMRFGEVCVFTVSWQIEEKERGNHNLRLISNIYYNMHSSMFAYCYLLRLLDLARNCIPAAKILRLQL
jgi:hypothetical protein